MAADLELFRELFKDKKSHIVIAKVKQLSLAQDRSFLKCLVSIFPDQREVIARMTWSQIGPDSGIVEFPSVDDLVLVAFADGENDYAFIISRLTSTEDRIPIQAIDGDFVLKAKAGKKAFLTSDTKIILSQGDTEPTENLVLGQQLKTLLIDTFAKLVEVTEKLKDLSTKVSTHTHAGNLGYPTSPPNESADFVTLASDFTAKGSDLDALSSSPVQDEKILSDLSFTEKGTF